MTGVILILIMLAGAIALATSWIRRIATRARLDDWIGAVVDGVSAEARRSTWLARWLGHAGFWNAAAPPIFIGMELGAVCVALAAMWVIAASGLVPRLAASITNIPGGVGEAMASVLSLAPWIVFLIVALAPVLYVRAQRRRVIREVDADLPLVLEIFATLAEAGLGFDASLVRLLDSTPGDRPLHHAFAAFHRDIRAGVPRVQAMRQMAARLDVPSVTVFVSAIVQAELVGAGIAGTLRRQADDVRDRRRERVALLGQLLPVKLMFPLVACFLPGIFLTTLGPALLQMVEVAGGFLR
jgi:pilus assembly protein TadC